jgi:preprotein translocase subunit SecE
VADDKDEAAADVPADPDLGDAELDDVELTESEKVAVAAAQARPTRKAAKAVESSRSGKGRATKKRSQGDEPEKKKRTTPAQFVREAIAELKKVVWPTWPQLQQYFVVVLVFVLIMITYVFFLDLGLGAAILKIFG